MSPCPVFSKMANDLKPSCGLIAQGSLKIFIDSTMRQEPLKDG